MKKNMVYFVLYVVLITELLIVITERDELQAVEHQIRDKMLNTLADIYKKPLLLTIPEKVSDFSIGSKQPKKVVLTPAGLFSEAEKNNVIFFVDIDPESKARPAGWPQGGISLDKPFESFRIEKENDNGVFIADFDRAGEYTFTAYCQVERVLPDYLPDKLLEELREQVGEQLFQKSDPEGFMINAKSIGGLKKKEAEIYF